MTIPRYPEGASPWVLLLDDSETMLELIVEMLAGLGFSRVMTATDGRQGLTVFDTAACQPAFLICDLNMPGMDGIEFMRHMAERGYGGDIILVSGTDSAVLKAAERLTRAHGLNFLGVLDKPFEPVALATLLANSGTGSRPARPPAQMLTPEEIRQGLSENHLELHFQPKVSTHGRQLHGVECLARWRHPQRGLLAPDAFMPVVEELGMGMIDAFTLEVFSKAVAQQRAWLDQGHTIRINVNLSMDNLRRIDLPEILDGIVCEAGLSPRDIVLEMTETRLMDNLRLCLDILIRLRLKGFGLSIDDFGTGYSTMENLKQLPFTELKVDRLFVNGADQDPAAHAILESSIRLGNSFGLNLVAEGVETRQDWDLVVASGCDEVQGYFVARPMPATDVIQWKKQWECTPERNEEMNDKARILVVDDDNTIQALLGAMLDGNYQVTGTGSGEAALAAVRQSPPDVILLDVEMPPGMDGYETCRRLKQDETTAAIPVIFLSARDCIEDRLKGYDAGGEDYLTKPFDAQELETKIAQRLAAVAERESLKQMADYASSAAMTAMTSLSEMGALLETMKRFSASADHRALADAVLAGLAPYGLRGVVQIRAPGQSLTRSHQGEASPLEESVIRHMAGMERIVQFKSRLSITYQHVSLLVHDMPTADDERCGRLRDHLAMLAEGAEARAQAIIADAESQRRGAGIELAVARITATLADIDRTQREKQLAARLSVESVTQRMEEAFISIAMSTRQEDYMSGILKDGLDHLLTTQTDTPDLQNRLTSIVEELQQMSACPAAG